MEEERVSIHEMSLKNIYFNDILIGKKTVEIRIFDKKRQKINVGDRILFKDEKGERNCLKIVNQIFRFDDFKKAIEFFGIENVLPGCSSVEEGVLVYENIPSYSESVKEYGCVCFVLS